MSDGRFPPGTSGNPNGRPPTPPDVREAMRYGRIDLARTIQDLFGMPPSDVRALLDNPDVDCLKGACAMILAIARTQGDIKRLNFLIENAYGKLPQNINLGSLAGEKRVTHADIMRLIEEKRTAKDGDTGNHES